MAYTQAELTEILGAFATLSPGLQEKMRVTSTDETSQAIAGVITQQRGQGMQDAMTQLVTASIANWTLAKQAAALADGAAIGDSLRSAKAAWDAEDDSAIGPATFAFLVVAFKYFNLSGPQS